jgi:hypothetical protein
MSIPVLLVRTPVGLGKTTVALEASDVLEATGGKLDAVRFVHPATGEGNNPLDLAAAHRPHH